MPSLYSHPHLYDRLTHVGVVDRFVRGITVTLEHVISVYAETSPRGIVAHILSADLIDPSGTPAMRTQLAIYPFSKLAEAEADAKTVATKLGLACRRADPHIGWQTYYNPDGEVVAPAASDDFTIG